MAITELASLQRSTGSVCTKDPGFRVGVTVQERIGMTETIRRIPIG